MTRPRIVNHATEIQAWTAKNAATNLEYALHPFAAHVAPCPGTCGGGLVVKHHHLPPEPCTPCSNQKERATT